MDSTKWPDEKLEKKMLGDAQTLAEIFDSGMEHGMGHDVYLHVVALMGRIRELEDVMVASQEWRQSDHDVRLRRANDWAIQVANDFEEAMAGRLRIGSYSLHPGIECLKAAYLKLLGE